MAATQERTAGGNCRTLIPGLKRREQSSGWP